MLVVAYMLLLTSELLNLYVKKRTNLLYNKDCCRYSSKKWPKEQHKVECAAKNTEIVLG